jgi:SAM-dependent methyltransferase
MSSNIRTRARLRELIQPTPQAHVARNIKAYAKRADSYDALHGEIFNDIEQQRLHEALRAASAAITSDGRTALDFGAGSGNLTRHMIGMGFHVTAADVSPDFLQIVGQRYKVKTIELTSGSLDCIPDCTYDLIGVYSVMHHIPNYLATAAGLVGKLAPGGVLLIDHECNESYWHPPPELAAFRRANTKATTSGLWDPDSRRWQRMIRAIAVPSRSFGRLRKALRIQEEGDIHVYPDDHIEWDRLLVALQEAGGELLARMDYLLFDHSCDRATWERYKDRCDDHTCVIVRRA